MNGVVNITRVELPPALEAAILGAAQAASPRECCGLLEGTSQGDTILVQALHPARNRAVQADRFDIEPADQFAAQRKARANGRAIVGCYHSHPGAPAAPSAADQAGAGAPDFLWLIAGRDGVRAFFYRGGKFEGLAMGADCVTSSS